MQRQNGQTPVNGKGSSPKRERHKNLRKKGHPSLWRRASGKKPTRAGILFARKAERTPDGRGTQWDQESQRRKGVAGGTRKPISSTLLKETPGRMTGGKQKENRLLREKNLAQKPQHERKKDAGIRRLGRDLAKPGKTERKVTPPEKRKPALARGCSEGERRPLAGRCHSGQKRKA